MPSDQLALATPFGAPLYLHASADAIIACEFRPGTRPTATRIRHAVLRDAATQLRAYFAHRLARFALPLALDGTPFQVAVWKLGAQLETGELISYGDVARAIGAPGAHRGVAAAMGKSPYDLLIPAHRVIGSDGKIKGAGPHSIRRRLLEFEGITLRQ